MFHLWSREIIINFLLILGGLKIPQAHLYEILPSIRVQCLRTQSTNITLRKKKTQKYPLKTTTTTKEKNGLHTTTFMSFY